MRTWLEATLAKLSAKSDTAAAIRYALSRWRALTRYVEDGQLDIDNNAAERALRVVDTAAKRRSRSGLRDGILGKEAKADGFVDRLRACRRVGVPWASRLVPWLLLRDAPTPG